MLNREKAPEFKEVDELKLVQAKKIMLDNGLNLYNINTGTQELVKIEFLFPAGILKQKSALLAESTNDLIGEGTLNYTSDEIAEKVDFYGAFLQKSATVDSASVVLYTLNKHLYNVLPILKELIFSSVFPQSELDLHIQNQKQEFNIDKTKVSTIARKKFKEVLFGSSHPYGYNYKETDFDKLSKSVIGKFYKDWYDLSKAQIIVSGKVTEEVVKVINANFGQISITETAGSITNNTIKVNSQNKHFIEKADSVQSAIRIGRPLFTRKHKDYAAFQVLNCILGGYFGSRLMANIREDKGYTYGIGSGLAAHKEFGYFFISTEVKAEVRELAVKEIYYEINRLRTEPIKEEELQLVKNYLMGSLLRSCDGPFDQSDRFKTLLINGLDYSYYDNYVKTIKEIKTEKIKELANKYLQEKDLFEVVAGK